MTPLTRRQIFMEGLLASLPYQIAICLFGLVSGALMADAGLTLFETVAMAVIVLAGAAQLAALQMLIEDTSIIVILLTCICINLRFGMYSAALSPYFVGVPAGQRRIAALVVHDQSFGVSLARFQNREEDWRSRLCFFLSVGAITALLWQSSTGLGHIIGAKAPESISIDFAMPIIFIALTVPFLRGRPRWLAAVVASCAALTLRDIPLDLGLLIATALGVGAGYWAETREAQE